MQKKGWTVQKLSDETGISKRSLDSYMRGSRSLAKAEAAKVLAISDLLNVDPHDLIKE